MKKMNRNGTVVLLLLILLSIGVIIARQIGPSEEMLSRRLAENGLTTDISQIREAFDMMKIASQTWQPWEENFDPDSVDAAASIAKILETLRTEGFLRSSEVYDSTTKKHLWGTGVGKQYWQASINLASNSSFQIYTGEARIWDWNQTDTAAATDTFFLNEQSIDDYPFQNKLGEAAGKSGFSLKIVR
mgnify:CR=1 FL=1